jgi:hypothetical protein
LDYILPAAEFSALTLDIQMGISWASDIEIKWFKSSNSSTRLGLQLWWRSRSEIKSFYKTETDSNLVGQKVLDLTILSIQIWLRICSKKNDP